MTKTELAEMIRDNTPAPRIDLRGLRGGLYAVAAAILLLALLSLPVSILAVEAIYAQVLIAKRVGELKTGQ